MSGMLGQYRLIDVIATGGMGQLHLAAKSGLEGFTKIAAVKCILPELAETPQFRQMFLEEARLAARLDHPNIVSTFELGEADGSYFIAMEYLPGEDLAAVFNRCKINDQKMPIGIALTIASACAEGLHFAHELPSTDGRPIDLVHRDVNPANIVVTYHGAVKLLDFGIAKMRGSTRRTDAGGFRGKVRYAAPEQVEGLAADRRTDVFCLGVVLWECLTGTHPFDGPTDAAVLNAIRERTVLPPGRFRSGVPTELDDVVLKALERAPEKRFQTAAELSSALARVVLEGDDSRSPHRIVRWLEQLFGAERAMLKIGIARGQRTATAVKDLAKRTRAPGDAKGEVSGFKTAWTVDLLRARAEDPPPVPREVTERRYLTDQIEPEKSPWLRWIWPVSAVLGIAAGVVLTVSSRPAEETSVPATGQALEITSTPSGASIYLDGEPTARKTPATFASLQSKEPIDVRLVSDGFRSAARTCSPGSGCDFTLERMMGRVAIEGLPSNARIFVDGREVPAASKLDLSVGRRMLRIEQDGQVLFEGSVEPDVEGTVVRLGGGE
jgi:eukaryotic-like serine/threonine-protein kinase